MSCCPRTPIPQFVKLDSDDRLAAWYDWFCKDSSLPARTDALMKRLLAVLRANGVGCRFNPATCYVFFKNNCPVGGPLYDDFRICDIATGDVLYTIVPKSGHTGRAEVWGGVEALVEGTWSDVIAFFEGTVKP